MLPHPELTEDHVHDIAETVGRVCDALGRGIVGQVPVIRQLTTALLAGGHVLLEGLPGLGKTHLVKGVARCFSLPLARVQCTPDLMPSDITGSEVLVHDEAGRTQCLEFRPGPIFAQMVLVDEINRAAPKTQAALLEAMQEGHVTYGGHRHDLPRPFWLVATQNPIELEGTYPLPEAQLDRFLYKLTVECPTKEALLEMVDVSLDDEPTEHLLPVLSPEGLSRIAECLREVVVAEPVRKAAVDLVLSTHPDRAESAPCAREHVQYGASPRGLQALLRAARVVAICDGRGHVSVADIETVALPALRHRVLLRMRSEMDGVRSDAVLQDILKEWRHRW